MTEEETKQCPFNPFDLTKVWPPKHHPLFNVFKLQVSMK
jgi:catalase